jgi:hypothetical protein
VNRTRLKRLEEAFQPDDPMDPRPTSPAGWHRLLLAEGPMQSLMKLSLEAFGPDDPRADAAYLRTLTYRQLLHVFRDGMKTVVERDLANGSMDWFRALPVEEKIRLLRQPERDWDEIDRLRRAHEANRDGRQSTCH